MPLAHCIDGGFVLGLGTVPEDEYPTAPSSRRRREWQCP
jgi:hypothetical protein